MIASHFNFFDPLYHHCEGNLEIRLLPSKRQEYFDLDDHAGIERYVRQNMNTNVLFGVGTRDGKGGRKDNLVNIPSVWCDADFKDTPKKQLGENLKRFPFKPSLINLSGGGAHLYWKLAEPAKQSDIKAIEDINQRIAHALGGDQGATEAARVLRVPGTRNYKYHPPRSVKLHRIEKFEYLLEDFSELPLPSMKKNGDKKPVTLEPVKNGARNITLTRIVGRYVGRGWSNDEVLTMACGWNIRCPEPQPMDDVVKTVKSIINTHEHNQSGDPNRGKAKRIRFSIV